MNRLFTLLTILLTTYIAYGQDEPYGYITNEPIVVYGYDVVNGISIPTMVKIATPNLMFRRIGGVRADANLGQVYLIQFWTITDEPDDIKSDSTKINEASTSTNQFYCIDYGDFKEPTVRKSYKTWTRNAKLNVGLLVFPIKFRPKQGDISYGFTTDFTLGSSFGYSFRMSHFQPNYISLVGVFGVTSVGVDSITTKGYITEPYTKLAAISPGIGVITEISNFQIGVIIGWDIIGGTTGKNWIYNNEPWFSFGIGYQFIKKNER